MRVLLTGATGLIGSAVLAGLRGAGHEVVAVVHNSGDTHRLPWAEKCVALDIAGIVEHTGGNVTTLAVGDSVCALTNDGRGYAEFCAVPAPQCLPVPAGFDFVRAAALPEVFFTAWNNVIWLGRLARGETLLVQGGTSGVGLAAIQIAKQLRGARVVATASSDGKLEFSRSIARTSP